MSCLSHPPNQQLDACGIDERVRVVEALPDERAKLRASGDLIHRDLVHRREYGDVVVRDVVSCFGAQR